MSVSFYVEPGKPMAYALSCHCEGSVSLHFNSVNDAYLFMDENPNYVLDDCDNDGYCNQLIVDVLDDTFDCDELNVSNFNARDVLEHLGVDVDNADWSGEFEPDDLLARINIALAVAPESAEMPAYDMKADNVGGAPIIYAGRPEGYVQEKLHALIPIAEQAKVRKRKVLWD